jgi:hypothetical protein
LTTIGIQLLLLGILALGRGTLACTKATDVYANTHVASTCKVDVLRIIACGRAIILAVWQILQQSRKLFLRLGVVGHVKSCGQPNTIFHRNPRFLQTNSVSGRRRWFYGESAETCENEKYQETD